MNLTGQTVTQRPEAESDDPAWFNMVKQLPCVICQAPPPSDAHHCIHGRYGTKKKRGKNAIPLCPEHHRHPYPEAIHSGKAKWAAKYGNDFDYLPQVRAAIEDQLLGKWF